MNKNLSTDCEGFCKQTTIEVTPKGTKNSTLLRQFEFDFLLRMGGYFNTVAFQSGHDREKCHWGWDHCFA